MNMLKLLLAMGVLVIPVQVLAQIPAQDQADAEYERVLNLTIEKFLEAYEKGELKVTLKPDLQSAEFAALLDEHESSLRDRSDLTQDFQESCRRMEDNPTTLIERFATHEGHRLAFLLQGSSVGLPVEWKEAAARAKAHLQTKYGFNMSEVTFVDWGQFSEAVELVGDSAVFHTRVRRFVQPPNWLTTTLGAAKGDTVHQIPATIEIEGLDRARERLNEAIFGKRYVVFVETVSELNEDVRVGILINAFSRIVYQANLAAPPLPPTLVEQPYRINKETIDYLAQWSRLDAEKLAQTLDPIPPESEIDLAARNMAARLLMEEAAHWNWKLADLQTRFAYVEEIRYFLERGESPEWILREILNAGLYLDSGMPFEPYVPGIRKEFSPWYAFPQLYEELLRYAQDE